MDNWLRKHPYLTGLICFFLLFITPIVLFPEAGRITILACVIIEILIFIGISILISDSKESQKSEIIAQDQEFNSSSDKDNITQESIDETVSDDTNTRRIHIFSCLFGRSGLAIISSILLITTIVLSICLYNNSNINQNLNSQLDKVADDNNRMQKSYDNLCEDNAEIKGKNNALSIENRLLRNKLSYYQDQQATIDDLNAKLNELHKQYDTLETERDKLQVQVDAKKAEQERIAREQEQGRFAYDRGGTVYWVPGGSVYHSTPDCATLKRSSSISSGTISQSGKRRACKVCN